MEMILLIFLIGFIPVNGCDPGWSYFNYACYKHIYHPTRLMLPAEAEADCAKRDSYLTSIESPEELKFVTALASRPGDWSSTVDSMQLPEIPQFRTTFGIFRDDWHNGLILGGPIATRNGGNYKWLGWPRSNSTYLPWCTRDRDISESFQFCLRLWKGYKDKASCVENSVCVPTVHYIDPRHTHHLCKKPRKCADGAELKANGKCVCKKGYFDIADTDCPERRDYKPGEMCISRTPCQNIPSTKSLTIVFIVDSSQSIGAFNWKNMVRFLKSGSQLLDNSIRVGFVQFSTNVTYSKWLPSNWDKDDYEEKMPTNFDAGYTNTPAALEEALKMFSTDGGIHKVAVLITDGMPYVEGILPQEDAMEKTNEAAIQLRRAKVTLVALGYGSELQKYQKYLKQILEKPQRDYFEYDKEAGDLRDIHMTVLLNKVCSRFQ